MPKEIVHGQSKLIIVPVEGGELECRADYMVYCPDCDMQKGNSVTVGILPANWKQAILQYYQEQAVPKINEQEGI